MATYQFTDLYKFDGNAGIAMPDIDDLKKRVEDMMYAIFGTNIDVTAETPLGRLIEMITVLMTQTLGINVQNANQYNLNQTSGIYLDAIGVLFGLPRHAATNTRVKCSLAGQPDTLVPTTVVVETEEGYKFSPENAITLDANGKATGYFIALESGPIPCDANTLTKITSGVVGLTSVINDTDVATEIGTVLESDTAYRARIITARATGSSSVEAIANAIYNSDSDISSCVVLENGRSQSVVKRGITIPPHSIYACVMGGDDNAIAKAIFNSKTAGCGYTLSAGSATLKKIRVSTMLMNQDIYFFRPIDTAIKFAVSADRYLYSGSDIEGDIRKTLVDFLSEKGIGSTIDRIGALRYLQEKMQTIRIDNLIMSLLGGEQTESISLDANRIGTTTDAYIDIVII